MLNTGLLIWCYFWSIFSTKRELGKSKTTHYPPTERKKPFKDQVKFVKKYSSNNEISKLFCCVEVCNSTSREISCVCFYHVIKAARVLKGRYVLKPKQQQKRLFWHYGNKMTQRYIYMEIVYLLLWVFFQYNKHVKFPYMYSKMSLLWNCNYFSSDKIIMVNKLLIVIFLWEKQFWGPD